jgi:hypothetical protein
LHFFPPDLVVFQFTGSWEVIIIPIITIITLRPCTLLIHLNLTIIIIINYQVGDLLNIVHLIFLLTLCILAPVLNVTQPPTPVTDLFDVQMSNAIEWRDNGQFVS